MLLRPSEHIDWTPSERLLNSLNITPVENDDHTSKDVPSLTYAPSSDSKQFGSELETGPKMGFFIEEFQYATTTISEILSLQSTSGITGNNNVAVTFGEGDAQVHISLQGAIDGDELHAVSVDAI
ncbi:hypothetical protein ANCCAN_11593 [Ancylostoma caninum]|uniref:Uncharacterized protein n=1 Tax=Ancylostoma caninum TaxID=29170 RepID=A0A368GDF9_ANCCA|nr:hypothetical protein ANCCAN_11593 [Ancylostoma caninum]